VSRAATPSVRRLQVELGRIDLDRLAVPALGVLLLVGAVVLVHLSRGASFWADDWLWITGRRGGSLDTFLSPYKGHLSVLALAIYRALFATAGIGSYAPYRLLVVVLSLLVVVLLFAYARPRVGPFLALLAAVSLLFLGPGWQNVLWPFQIPSLIVCAAGIGALMLLDRRTRSADIAASALTLLAICSTSLGLVFAVGIAVDVGLSRRRWRDAWIVVVPLALYAIWALGYQPNPIKVSAFPTVPVNLAKAAAAALSAPTGLSGYSPLNDANTSLTYGWPLLVVATVIMARRTLERRAPIRALSLAVVFVAFVTLITVAHVGSQGALASRYLYVYALLALLLAVEFLRGVRVPRLAQVALGLLTVLAVISNVGPLRSGGGYFRAQGMSTNGALTAVAVDRGHVAPDTVVHVASYESIALTARSILAAEQAWGSPAYSLAQLRSADAVAQTAADAQLLADGDVTLGSASLATVNPASSAGIAPSPPSVTSMTNGTTSVSSSCVRFTPAASLAPATVASFSLKLGEGVTVTTSGASATLAVRRFAPTFTALGTLAADRSTQLTVRPGSAPDPWYLQLTSVSPVRVCARQS
jgi:hypothetical protein